MMMTLGSLFDGVGGFSFAAKHLGIKPVWSSEIVPSCISITKRHFPDIKHLGDITKINGTDVEPVDIVTFGSPCQDLSIAGKRVGLTGERSGLFLEAVRIIKEMRNKTNERYPAFVVWENVFGAFSSNEGEDFRIVLQEIAGISDAGVSIPRSQRWLPAGAIMGNGWSLAWRTLDAQYWGVPQRRRRIFLVADFGGRCAGKILFKPESPAGNTAESGEKREGTACGIAASFGETGQGYWQEGIQCLRAEGGNRPSQPGNIIVLNDQGGDSINIEKGDVSPCLRSEAHGNLPVVSQYTVDFGRVGDRIQMNAEKAVTLQGEAGGGAGKTGLYCLPYQDTVGSLCSRDYKGVGNQYVNENKLIAAFSQQRNDEYKESNVSKTLAQRDYKSPTDLISTDYAVRRLTPTECERLQGFPDGYTEFGLNPEKYRTSLERGKKRTGLPENILLQKISDAARYKALGNSVAIPCVLRVLSGIKDACETDN